MLRVYSVFAVPVQRVVKEFGEDSQAGHHNNVGYLLDKCVLDLSSLRNLHQGILSILFQLEGQPQTVPTMGHTQLGPSRLPYFLDHQKLQNKLIVNIINRGVLDLSLGNS